MAEFKEGDTVELKSGGPAMTIQRIDENDYAFCDWFTKHEQDTFPITSLKKTRDEFGLP